MIGRLINNRTNEEYAITESPTPIGRHEANIIRLRGFAVSRFHAEIGETAPGKPYIEDMGSTYGTYVNGRKIEGRVSLHDGDEIRLAVSGGFPDGEYSFTFRMPKNEELSTERPREKPPTRHTIREGRYELKDLPGAYVFHLDGVFRRNECDSVAAELLGRMRGAPKDVIIELSRVEYMNSYGLGIIVRLSQDVAQDGKRLVLAGAQGLVLKLFQTVGLDKRLGCYPSEKEAIEALQKAL